MALAAVATSPAPARAQSPEAFFAGKDVRILIGSTERMGIGTNVQTRLYALHDVDIPHRPSDLEQRRGRIERQGNTNEVIRVLEYTTEQTFDGFMWQQNRRKAGFIDQLFRWQTIIGLGCYGGAALLYIVALRKIPMSIALPCTAASYVVIAVIGWAVFGEAMGMQKVLAIGLISLGVVLLATTV
jgi:multidrug transporter EmrE-like cation transporter